MPTADGASLRASCVREPPMCDNALVIGLVNGARDWRSALFAIRKEKKNIDDGAFRVLNLRLSYDPHIALPGVPSISQTALIVTVVHHAWQHLHGGEMMILRLVL